MRRREAPPPPWHMHTKMNEKEKNTGYFFFGHGVSPDITEVGKRMEKDVSVNTQDIFFLWLGCATLQTCLSIFFKKNKKIPLLCRIYFYILYIFLEQEFSSFLLFYFGLVNVVKYKNIFFWKKALHTPNNTVIFLCSCDRCFKTKSISDEKKKWREVVEHMCKWRSLCVVASRSVHIYFFSRKIFFVEIFFVDTPRHRLFGKRRMDQEKEEKRKKFFAYLHFYEGNMTTMQKIYILPGGSWESIDHHFRGDIWNILFFQSILFYCECTPLSVIFWRHVALNRRSGSIPKVKMTRKKEKKKFFPEKKKVVSLEKIVRCGEGKKKKPEWIFFLFSLLWWRRGSSARWILKEMMIAMVEEYSVKICCAHPFPVFGKMCLFFQVKVKMRAVKPFLRVIFVPPFFPLGWIVLPESSHYCTQVLLQK